MNGLKKKITTVMFIVIAMASLTTGVGAMHIAEGVLSIGWSIFWSVLYLPFLVLGIASIKQKCKGNGRVKMLLAMSGAFCFVLSALKMPSLITASSSHPTGVGFGTVIFGPAAMGVLGFIVLVFQALLLAHGGLTTLGANAFSMAVVGPFVGYGIFVLCKKLPMNVRIFLTAASADLVTYMMTSLQLALAFHNETVSFTQSLVRFLSIFAMTQIPIAIAEGILTVIVYNAITVICNDELHLLRGKQGKKGAYHES